MSADAIDTTTGTVLSDDLSADLAAGHLRLECTEQVWTVVLDRPEQRNAQTPATWHALERVGRLVEQERPRVVVLRAEGTSFSAGLDRSVFSMEPAEGGSETLGTLAVLPPDDLDQRIGAFQRAFTWWREVPALTVAAVQGHAVGAGFQLALGCDLRVLADDARLAMREPSLGLVPDLGGTGPLVAAVGYPRALEICATGRWVHAAEAERLGLAQAVVPVAELAAATEDLVAALLATPERALAETLELLRGATTRTSSEQLAAERAAQGRLLREAVGRPSR